MYGSSRKERWNEYLLHYTDKVRVPEQLSTEQLQQEGIRTPSLRDVLTLTRICEQFGYLLDAPLVDHLQACSHVDFLTWASEMQALFKAYLGQRDNQEAFYPLFPAILMPEQEVARYHAAWLHYLTAGEWHEATQERFECPLEDHQPLTLLSKGDLDALQEVAAAFLQCKHPLKRYDYEFVVELLTISSFSTCQTLLEAGVSFKENLAQLIVDFWDTPKSALLTPHLKNPTDVLRVIDVYQEGNGTLSHPINKGRYPRKFRRFILNCLEEQPQLAENLWHYRQQWLTIGRLFHVGSYQATHPRTYAAFDRLRNQKKPLFFNGRLEYAYEQEQLTEVLSLLVARPNVLARRLHQTLRLEQRRLLTQADPTHPSLTLTQFEQAVEACDSKVLWTLIGYFNQLRVPSTERFFHLKQAACPIWGMANELTPLPMEWIEKVITLCEQALIQRYRERYLNEQMENQTDERATLSEQEKGAEAVVDESPIITPPHVYLDPALTQYLLPLHERDTSNTLMCLARGTRIPIDATLDHVRLFLYWHQANHERVDLDLSAGFLTEDFTFCSAVSFMNLQDEALQVVHSGDFVSAKQGAAEYIDFSLSHLATQQVRYVLCTASSYTQQKFEDIGECFVGLMLRESETGRLFEPKTVKEKFDLVGRHNASLFMVVDVKTRELIWTDYNFNSSNGAEITNQTQYLTYMTKAAMQATGPTLHDLCRLHALAQDAIWVDAESEATLVYGGQTGLQPIKQAQWVPRMM